MIDEMSGESSTVSLVRVPVWYARIQSSTRIDAVNGVGNCLETPKVRQEVLRVVPIVLTLSKKN